MGHTRPSDIWIHLNQNKIEDVPLTRESMFQCFQWSCDAFNAFACSQNKILTLTHTKILNNFVYFLLPSTVLNTLFCWFLFYYFLGWDGTRVLACSVLTQSAFKADDMPWNIITTWTHLRILMIIWLITFLPKTVCVFFRSACNESLNFI